MRAERKGESDSEGTEGERQSLESRERRKRNNKKGAGERERVEN
jgi:hypothetical protein